MIVFFDLRIQYEAFGTEVTLFVQIMSNTVMTKHFIAIWTRFLISYKVFAKETFENL